MSKAELVDLGCQVGLCCNDSDYSSEDDKSSINMWHFFAQYKSSIGAPAFSGLWFLRRLCSVGRSISWTLVLLRRRIKLTLARFVTILPRLVPKQNEKYFKQYNVQSRSLLISTLPANLRWTVLGNPCLSWRSCEASVELRDYVGEERTYFNHTCKAPVELQDERRPWRCEHWGGDGYLGLVWRYLIISTIPMTISTEIM